MITQAKIEELLRTKESNYLFHKESITLEFKESFSKSGLAEYFKDFAAFSNNRGGYLIFGVTDRPRKIVGLNEKSLNQFESIDEEKISGFINDHLSPYVDWEQSLIIVKRKKIGVMYIHESLSKPVICKKNDDKNKIKNGEIYYRYGGRSEVIQYSELNYIIEQRIKENNQSWISKVKEIGESGPQYISLLDTKKGFIKNKDRKLMIDEKLLQKIKFVQEGNFKEMVGTETLQLIGSVETVSTVEVEKIISKRLVDDYPFSYTELCHKIKTSNSNIKLKDIQDIIKESNMKNNLLYSAYNFRNKSQEENYKENGIILKSFTSIYNMDAINYIIKVYKQNII